MKLLLLVTLVLGWFSMDTPSRTGINVENAQRLAEVKQITYENQIIRDLTFQPNGDKLAVIRVTPQTTLNGEVTFLDRQTLEEISFAETILKGTVLTYSPDGSLLALGTEEGEITVYDANTLEQRYALQTSPDIVNDLAISPDNAYLGATFAIPTIGTEGEDAFQLISLPSGQKQVFYPLDDESQGIYGGGVAFDDSSQFVFFSTTNMTTQNGVVYIWGIASGKELTKHEGFASNAHELLFEPRSEELYYAASNGIKITSALESNTEPEMEIGYIQKNESITKLALHPKELILAVAYYQPLPDVSPPSLGKGIIRVYDKVGDNQLISLEVPIGAITSLAFNPDGTLLASGGMDGTVRLWGIPEM